jgi:hypothetical protein
MTASGEPLLRTQLAVDTRAWEFLIDASKVSFDAMADFIAGAVTVRPRQNSQTRPAQPPLKSVSA